MLKSLRVRDLALIASAEVSFGPGLNLLTGETGSGKSLVVDALTLSLGARASAEQVRHGSERALVESVFEISDVPAALALLEEMGFEAETELVLSREIGGRGSSRLNGRPASPGQLRRLGRALVDVHGQHEHQSLLDPDAQTRLLDSYADSGDLVERVAGAHAAWREKVDELRDLQRAKERGIDGRDLMLWQLAELDRSDLRPGEDEELKGERAVGRHAVRLTELTQGARDGLGSDDGVVRSAAMIRSAAELDPRLAAVAERLEVLGEEVREIAEDLRRYEEAIDADPARLEAVESRLHQLEEIKFRSLQRGQDGTIESAIEEREKMRAELARTEDFDKAIAEVTREVGGRWTSLEGAAAALTERRQEGAERMGAEVTSELAGLHLAGSRFKVDLEPRPELGAEGAEAVAMLFSANPGEPLGMLARVASGGELARVMLAIKTVGAEADRLPTLIFDEVDAGIGGEAAIQVGVRLRALGAGKQVLVVTHLAQIAAFADHHLLVAKAPGAEGRNLVRVHELAGGGERAAELARMMSGGVTDKALARAHELLEEAQGG
jgi:DNA repair protein RecN (Recombination protein N)